MIGAVPSKILQKVTQSINAHPLTVEKCSTDVLLSLEAMEKSSVLLSHLPDNFSVVFREIHVILIQSLEEMNYNIHCISQQDPLLYASH
jgi:hypothetical protein